MKFTTALVFLCTTLAAQDLTGKWTGTADTVDASGIKRQMQETIEIKGAGGTITGLLVGRKGGGIPLRVIQEGDKVTFVGDLDFEGGEHLRWHFEVKGNRLVGTVWSVHDSPKKWGVDWTGPVELRKAE